LFPGQEDEIAHPSVRTHASLSEYLEASPNCFALASKTVAKASCSPWQPCSRFFLWSKGMAARHTDLPLKMASKNLVYHFVGPYEIESVINLWVICLNLPANLRLDFPFHISQIIPVISLLQSSLVLGFYCLFLLPLLSLWLWAWSELQISSTVINSTCSIFNLGSIMSVKTSLPLVVSSDTLSVR
jgi:hypothetical protein